MRVKKKKDNVYHQIDFSSIDDSIHLDTVGSTHLLENCRKNNIRFYKVCERED